ncbi:MAG: TonB-dependent receptor [Pseudomonadota bacterium]
MLQRRIPTFLGCLYLAMLMLSGVVAAQGTVNFEVSPQNLAPALEAFTRQSGVQVSAAGDALAGRTTDGVSGALDVDTALGRLLAGTGLGYRFVGPASVVLSEAQPDETGTGAPVVLAPLVVTARRTEEALSDVPGSVVVLSDEELQRSGIEQGIDAFRRIPNISFTETADPANINLSIRGLSNFIGTAGSGPVNGIFQNGILLNATGSLAGTDAALVDLERVETAFGPQGTAFGRGTIGGAINFVTRRPTDEFEASLEGEVGSYPDGRATAIVNLPLLEDGLLSARFVAFGGMSDGFLDFAPGESQDSLTREDAGGRLSLRSRPTDRLTLDASISFDRSGFDGQNSATLESVQAGDPVSAGNFIDESSVSRLLGSFQASYDFDVGQMQSTTSFFQSDVSFLSDTDFTLGDFFVTDNDEESRSIAQELRFESDDFRVPGGAGEIAFNLGASVSFDRLELINDVDPGADAFAFFGEQLGLGPLPDDGSSFGTITERDAFNAGIYGDVRWRLIPDLEITAGGRFSFDRIESTSETVSSGLSAILTPPVPSVTDDASFTAVTPSASIKYDWTDDFSTYLAFSTGFRPGGFATVTSGVQTFDEERARSIEGGFRAAFLERRLLVSGTGYFVDYEDIQVGVNAVVDSFVQPIIDNAAAARSVGAEIGVVGLPIEGLRLEGRTGVNFAKFTDFTDSPFGDITGQRLPNAPVHTVSITADYEHPREVLPGVRAFVRTDYTFRSSFTSLIDSEPESFDGFDVLDFRIGVRGNRFEAEAFVENALDEVYATGTTSLGSAVAIGAPQGVDVGPTRRFGLRARVLF